MSGPELPPGPVPGPGARPPRGGRTLMGTLGALLTVLICLVYVANPGLGAIELIPDILPFGNIDEAGAGAALVFAFSYLLRGRRPR